MSSRRSWTLAFAALVAVIYSGTAFEIAHSRFLLVDDFRPFAFSRLGVWPEQLAQTLFDFTGSGAWLYRPFPDVMEWLLSALFREQPGAWHLVIFSLRIVTVLCALAAARDTASPPSAVAAAAYLAFFPAVPEIHLLRAENWLMPLLAIVLLGWTKLETRVAAKGLTVTAAAFVLATMSKEIVAPLMGLLLLLLARHYWRRGTAARTGLVVMAIALANQCVRFALMFFDPYAGGGGGGLLQNAFWVAKVLLFPIVAFPAFAIVPAVLFLLGAKRLASLLRDAERRVYAAGVAGLFLGALTMAVAAPYPAIRYVYPAALFAVPWLALGLEELGTRARPVVAATAMLVLALFGGTAIWAQAAAARASNNADWALLQRLATAFAAGRDVAVIDDADFERSFWMRAELAGVDPRWPFLSHVARSYAAGKPVAWPPAPAGPVNLTGKRGTGDTGARFLLVPKSFDFARLRAGAMIVPANPFSEFEVAPPSLEIAERIDRRLTTPSARALDAFHRFALRLNRRHRFGRDLGETEFPGHYWGLFSRRISRAGLPPTSV